jgi:hypothetical protein
MSSSWNSSSITEQTSENQTENTYSHGKGATNMTRTLLSVGYLYFDWFPKYELAPDTYERYTTNRDVFAWGTNGLLTGIGTNSDHTIDYYWFPPISVLGADTNAVVVNTNVAPPTVPYTPWTLAKSGTMTTNYDNSTNITGITTNFWSEKSTLSLATAGTDTNLSALFCLTGSVRDPYSFWPIYNVPVLSGWNLAGEVPDGEGRVFKIYGDGTTNDASVVLHPILSGPNHYYTYTVDPKRVPLVLEWKSPLIPDAEDNWSSAPIHVAVGTTLDFRVQTGPITNVTWPTGLPTWSGNGVSGVGSRFSITFNNRSSSTNGEEIVVAAGSKATNRVVVFDYQVKFQTVGLGRFEGRPTNTTTFGVGETVSLVPEFQPTGVLEKDAGPFRWSATGMNATGLQADRSIPPSFLSSIFQAGAFPESITVTATIDTGPSEGVARTNILEVIKPSNAVLKDLALIVTNIVLGGHVYLSPVLVTNTSVFHTSNMMVCRKVSAFFLEPKNVSFHGINVREGAGPAQWEGGNTNLVVHMITNNNGQEIFWITNTHDRWPDHDPTGTFMPVSHPIRALTGPVEPNHFGHDRFGVEWRNTATLPVFVNHPVQLVTRIEVTIPIEYEFKSAAFYVITNLLSEKEVYTSGRTSIRKAGSGWHTKEFSDPDSPE